MIMSALDVVIVLNDVQVERRYKTLFLVFGAIKLVE